MGALFIKEKTTSINLHKNKSKIFFLKKQEYILTQNRAECS